MKILRYAAPGAPAWKLLRGGRVLLNDIFRHALLLLLTHSSDIGYPIVVYQIRKFKVIQNILPERARMLRYTISEQNIFVQVIFV